MMSILFVHEVVSVGCCLLLLLETSTTKDVIHVVAVMYNTSTIVHKYKLVTNDFVLLNSMVFLIGMC